MVRWRLASKCFWSQGRGKITLSVIRFDGKRRGMRFILLIFSRKLDLVMLDFTALPECLQQGTQESARHICAIHRKPRGRARPRNRPR